MNPFNPTNPTNRRAFAPLSVPENARQRAARAASSPVRRFCTKCSGHPISTLLVRVNVVTFSCPAAGLNMTPAQLQPGTERNVAHPHADLVLADVRPVLGRGRTVVKNHIAVVIVSCLIV